MRTGGLMVLAALLSSCVLGCGPARTMKGISQVMHVSESGTILPELQWYEETVITRDTITLRRNGKVLDTQVNAGTWEWAADREAVGRLFAQLEGIDPSSIREVGPDEPTEGGGAESYIILYGRGKKLILRYTGGATYTNGALVTQAVDAFLRSLEPAAEAQSRYRFRSEEP